MCFLPCLSGTFSSGRLLGSFSCAPARHTTNMSGSWPRSLPSSHSFDSFLDLNGTSFSPPAQYAVPVHVSAASPAMYAVQPPQDPIPQQVAMHPPSAAVAPPAQPQQMGQAQTTVVHVHHDAGVNHCCHCLLCCFTAGLWCPFWVCACMGVCCERPCG